jgi:hypothetical protein
LAGAGNLALRLHAALAGSVLVGLAVVNALVDRSTWWVLWVAWVWGMMLAAHAGTTLRWHGWLGTHAMVIGTFGIGIAGTNLALGGGLWAPWVLLAASAPLVGHWMMDRRGTPLLGAQAVVSGILFLDVVAATILHPSVGWNAGLAIAGSMLVLCVLLVGTLLVTGRRGSA